MELNNHAKVWNITFKRANKFPKHISAEVFRFSKCVHYWFFTQFDLIIIFLQWMSGTWQSLKKQTCGLLSLLYLHMTPPWVLLEYEASLRNRFPRQLLEFCGLSRRFCVSSCVQNLRLVSHSLENPWAL